MMITGSSPASTPASRTSSSSSSFFLTYKRKKLLLEELVLEAGVEAGLEPVIIMINAQEFTKTSNAWGVDNLSKGTNTNRIVIFENVTNHLPN